ncbi:hypothetical protein GDO81_014588 [Engystomops pustulosus]|uniref:Uncharacterized protein n=1 Tax=Engystomops pustulosus TaxID=76066 RepID=A0AAV7BBL0_ENGPU|nr:hypothetical protein GDO81_014588 [Engystomops pustulosus]
MRSVHLIVSAPQELPEHLFTGFGVHAVPKLHSTQNGAGNPLRQRHGEVQEMRTTNRKVIFPNLARCKRPGARSHINSTWQRAQSS